MPDGTFVEKKGGGPAPPPREANHSPVIDDDWGEMTSEAIRERCMAGAPRNAFVRNPVLRRAYLLLFVLCTLLILVPLWTLLYLPRSNRPRRSWTLKRCLRVRWSRRLCAVVARCEIDYLGRDLSVELDPLTLEWSHPVTLQPAPAHWLRGHPAAMLEKLHQSRGSWVPHFVHRYRAGKAGVWGRWNPPAHAPPATPYGFAPVPAFWYTGRKVTPTSRPRARHPGDPVLLVFHGGGYVLGTAAETDLTSSIAKAAVQHTPVRHVLSVDYRLAGTGPWPLPLLDAISAYHHIVKVDGVDESDLLLGGDSAGAHLALALARYLRDEGRALGLKGPRGIIALSPWSDIGFTHSWGTDAFTRNAESDTIDNSLGPFAVSLLLRALPSSLMHTNTYLSPSSQLIPPAATGPDSFENFPPVFIVCGGAERLESEIHELFHRILLARDKPLKGVADELIVRQDAVHDFMIFPHFADEAAVVFEHMDDWLRQLLLSDSESDGEAEAAGAAAEELAAKSPELFATSPKLQAALARRESHRASRAARASMLSGKSPRLRPYRDTPRQMYGDMQAEGLHLIDIPPLDLDALHLPQAAAEIFTPFTSQMEKGEWDFGDEGEQGWYEGGGSGDDDEVDDDEEATPPPLALPPPAKIQPRRRR